MPRGEPSPKLAITVDPEVHRRIVAAAAADGVSVSAWMTDAARRTLKVRDGLEAVAEWERVHDEDGAHRAGRLLGLTGTADVVDATVAVVAADLGAVVLTGDRGDIERLLASTGSSAAVVDV